MAPYGAAQSPSLRKTEANTSRFEMRPRKRFNVGHVVGDPFALATTSISILAWLIAFVSSVIADINFIFPKFIWWVLTYMFCCIIGIIITVASDSVHTFHVAIVGFLSAGMVFTTSAVNELVYSSQGSFEAGAAGFILLSMVSIVWIFYFGSQPQASHRIFVDSFALHKGEPTPRSSRQMSNRFTDARNPSYGPNAGPQLYNSQTLQGFETSSPTPGFQGVHGVLDSNSSQPRFGDSMVGALAQQPMSQGGPMTAGAESEVSQPSEYPYKARAIYSYEANPDDPNEIGFAKHEILEVSDVSGRWWQAKKTTGETGIAPSNYLILL